MADAQPTFFDEPAEEDWQEVPAARFLSWSPQLQAAYCAERDEWSAIEATTKDEARFFLERSEHYRRISKA